jgi:Uma2 family endonuclease
MEAHRTPTRWTYAEFARVPSEGSTRHEVIAGELVLTPAPTPRHQRVVARITTLLNGFVEGHALGVVFPGPIDVLFAEGDYLEPDLVFVRRGREAVVSDRGIEGPPDLVVEILSPSTESRDRGLKLDRYRHFGVGEYWIVDPDGRTVEVWKLAAGDQEPLVLAAEQGLRWTPVAGSESLDVPVARLFPEAG